MNQASKKLRAKVAARTRCAICGSTELVHPSFERAGHTFIADANGPPSEAEQAVLQREKALALARAQHEFAPDCCIVCAKPMPRTENNPGWTYLSGVQPMGAVTCSDACLQVALMRHEQTGRVDVPRQTERLS